MDLQPSIVVLTANVRSNIYFARSFISHLLDFCYHIVIISISPTILDRSQHIYSSLPTNMSLLLTSWPYKQLNTVRCQTIMTCAGEIAVSIFWYENECLYNLQFCDLSIHCTWKWSSFISFQNLFNTNRSINNYSLKPNSTIQPTHVSSTNWWHLPTAYHFLLCHQCPLDLL